MKLVSTLPERPGFLHAVPAFDLFALLLVFLLLGPGFVVGADRETRAEVAKVAGHFPCARVPLRRIGPECLERDGQQPR